MRRRVGMFIKGEKVQRRNPISIIYSRSQASLLRPPTEKTLIWVAALLHDAIEDQEVPHDLIVREFGSKVGAIVAEVTDDKTLAKDERKRRQIETAHKKH